MIKVILSEAISILLNLYKSSPPLKQASCRELAEKLRALCNEHDPESVVSAYEVLIGVPAFTSPKNLQKKDKWKAGFILNIYRIMHGIEPLKRPVYFDVKELPWWVDVVEEYTLDQKERGLSERTIYTRKTFLPYFMRYIDSIGIRDIHQLSFEVFERFLLFLGELEYSGWTKNNILYSLRDFVKFLIERKMMGFNPLVLLSGFRDYKHHKIPRFYTPDEVRRLIGAIDRSTDRGKAAYLILLLAAVYGMRGIDISILTLSNIQWDSNVISFVQHKVRRTVELPMIPEVRYAILDYVKNARPETDSDTIIIKTVPPYEPFKPGATSMSSFIVPLFEKAELDVKGRPRSVHALRYSLATMLNAMETPINEIAEILGHASAQTTLDYVWSDIEHLRLVAKEVLPYVHR